MALDAPVHITERKAVSLCQVMKSDYLNGTGRFDERGTELYTDEDLRFGSVFARGWIEEGDTVAYDGMALAPFAEWCEAKLRAGDEGSVK